MIGKGFSSRNGENKFNLMDFLKKYASQIQVFFVAIFLYLVYRKFLKEDKPTKKPHQTSDSHVKQEDEKGSTLSIHRASIIAEGLYSAFNVWNGTDEDTIYELLKDLSEADYNKVYNIFGLRSYNHLLGEATLSWLGVQLSLTEWLVNELNREELKKLKSLNPRLPI